MIRATDAIWNWTSFALIVLGVWLIATALSFSMQSLPIFYSDILSGCLLLVFGYLSIAHERQWSLWAATFVGIWLQFAPLVFWAPYAVSYLNDTLIGVLAIAFSILIPGTPGSQLPARPDVPPGWTFNPSAWLQRLPIITACLLCWMISRYMAAYQLGYLDRVWDPLFGDGTLRVITSPLSQSFPISDAGLGAIVYTLEFLLGLKGGSSRWYSMPWMVVVFGIMVVPAGLVSILLIMSQPIIVGYWCGWCLLTALLMLFMIAFTFDEVVAVIQFLYRTKQKKLPFWSTFWKGGEAPEETHEDIETPPFDAPLSQTLPPLIRGISFPWNLNLSLLIGIYMMFVPNIFMLHGVESDFLHITGALVASFSMIAMSETARPLRFFNMLFGICLVVVPLFFIHATPIAQWNSIISGALLILLSLYRGPIHEKYGSWNAYIR